MLFSQASIHLALAASATAHMLLSHPVPFHQVAPDNGPIDPFTPGDFPCRQHGTYRVDNMTQWNAGETYTVDFLGSAVHAGGSCQFSITTDTEPSEKSQWKVIQSVIGGCPANAKGNLEGGADARVADKFPVTMPSNIPDGQYTFAWTWLNKKGAREFYMNCAPIKVGSGSGNASTASAASALSALPDMFVANLATSKCTTVAEEDFVYPDPGQNVVTGKNATPGPGGAGCAKSESKPPSYSGGIFAPGASSAPAAGPTVQPSPPAAEPVPTAQPSPPAAEPVPSAQPSPPAVEPVPSAQPSPPAAEPVASVAPSQPSGAPSCGTPKSPNSSNDTNTPTTPVAAGECSPCTNDGAVVCIGTNQFGLCNRGCAVPQNLAAGMACSNGVVVAAAKRSINFPRAHLHRRHGSSRFI